MKKNKDSDAFSKVAYKRQSWSGMLIYSIMRYNSIGNIREKPNKFLVPALPVVM